MNLTGLQLVKYKMIAKFFNRDLTEIIHVFDRYHRRNSYGVSKQEIWKLIVAGLNTDTDSVDELAKKYEEIKLKRNRQSLGEVQRKRISLRDKNLCRYCRKKLSKNKQVIDHVVPWSRGGRNSDENLVLCCRDCNNKKRDNLLEEINMILLPAPI